MEKVIVSVGMGIGQLPFIEKVSQRGIKVISFGKGANSKRAMEISLFWKEIDTSDYKGAIEWIESLDVEVIGIGSLAGGNAVVTVQKLSNYFHVSTSVPNNIIVDNDKIKQQAILESYNLTSIKTWDACDISPQDLLIDICEDYIVKPKVGRGSRGVYFAKKNDIIDMLSSGKLNGNIVQSVRNGIEYRCLIIVQDKVIKLLVPVKRTSYRETSLLGMLEYDDTNYNEISGFIKDFVEKSRIVSSIIKMDLIVHKDGIDVIEMDVGVGGGYYFKKYISELFNCDLLDIYISLILGQEINEMEVVFPNLKMDYVYNRHNKPIYYNIMDCYDLLKTKVKSCEIVENMLHPEIIGKAESNADFIFVVIYKDSRNLQDFEIDSIINKYIFKCSKE